MRQPGNSFIQRNITTVFHSRGPSDHQDIGSVNEDRDVAS